MKNPKGLLGKLLLLLLLVGGIFAFTPRNKVANEKILSYTIDCKTQNLDLYWKDDKGEKLKSILKLKEYVESKHLKLLFATNAGMFDADFSPIGLCILKGKTKVNLNTRYGKGNFYLQPNGVFYVTIKNEPIVCKTTEFRDAGDVKYATQSGPMLVIDGKIHPAFKKGSTNLNIRNGVGILPNNKIVFAMSKSEINFYDFAEFFQQLGCKNALYLDGFVSRTYLPEKNWTQTDGAFGLMIGVTEIKKP